MMSKKFFALLLCALLLAVSVCALADTAKVGTATITIPDGWTAETITDEDAADGMTAWYFNETADAEIALYEDPLEAGDTLESILNEIQSDVDDKPTAADKTTINGIECVYSQYSETDDDVTYYDTQYVFIDNDKVCYIVTQFTDEAGNNACLAVVNTLTR